MTVDETLFPGNRWIADNQLPLSFLTLKPLHCRYVVRYSHSPRVNGGTYIGLKPLC